MRFRNLLALWGFLVIFFSFSSLEGHAQNQFEKALLKKMDSLMTEKETLYLSNQVILPNNSVQSIMTPSGWGGGNTTYLFAVIGGVYPSPYTEKGDLIAVAGFNFGDPVKYISVSTSVNFTRVTELRDLSLNLILSRQLKGGSSISVGGLQLLANSKVSDAPEGTYFVAFSHAVQTVRSKTRGYSGLGYTIGIGNGRFYEMSPYDVAAGKGKHGTAVFANVSYELFRQLNINLEWSGMNLGISSGIRPIKDSPLTFGFGVYNLTNFSGDRVSFMGSLGYPFSLDKKRRLL